MNLRSIGKAGRFYFLGSFLVAIGVGIVNPDHIASFLIMIGVLIGAYAICISVDKPSDPDADSGRG